MKDNFDYVKEYCWESQAIRTLYSLWKRDEVEQCFDLSEQRDFCWEKTLKELERILLAAIKEES